MRVSARLVSLQLAKMWCWPYWFMGKDVQPLSFIDFDADSASCKLLHLLIRTDCRFALRTGNPLLVAQVG
jgi:hypothetical protein